jgi:signal transduction histidine kinase
MSSPSPGPTDFKEAKDKLVRESHQLHALLDAIPDTIYFKDMQSRFVLVSRSKLQQALERTPDIRRRRVAGGLQADVPEPEMLTGLTDFDAYQNDDARIAFGDEQQIIRSGEAMIGQLEKQVFLDKTRRWWLTSKMPWRDGNGAIIGTFGISKDVTALKEAEEKLELMHRQLLDASRHAGMAEIATGVIHNVGNVLNSVNVSATLISDKVHHTKAANVEKLAKLFSDHKSDLADFLTTDARGKMIPEYLATLAGSLAAEQDTLIKEIGDLRKNIDHIKDIVSMQQSYARTSGIFEVISVSEMIEDVMRINAISLARNDIVTLCDYQGRPVITTDRHKVMQILINLVRNAENACIDSGRTDKKVTVRVVDAHRHVRIAVVDNGVGIPQENLSRVFNHGFTTRKNGHGFGLHSSALAAKELGGSLTAQSEGTGCGATFILELLHEPVAAANEDIVH